MDPDRLKERIKRHEGYSQHPYKDHLGNLTIGYGHLIEYITDKGLHERWLDEDIANATRLAHAFATGVWDDLTDARREVLIEMAFQLGSRILKFKAMQAALLAGDHQMVVREMGDSKWARQTPNRVHELQQVYLAG